MLRTALFLIVFVFAILIIPLSDAYADITQSVRVNADSDSYEENVSNGNISSGSSDLEMVQDGSDQTIHSALQ